MKLSLVFELLLIFVLLAFAASKSVKHRKNDKKGLQKDSETDIGPIEDSSINKYCKCIDSFCNCCRDFALPLVNLNGPGCATLTYLSGDKMAVSLSFGKKVITNRTLSSKKPSPVCMPLPGGISKFCGRVYNIARTGEDFRACLGLELQSKSTVEAAVRVSCFKFGAKGVTSEPADPLPLIPDEKGDDDDDDDDDDGDYGLGADEDDDDDDDDDDDEDSELDAVNDVESADYTGFSLLGEDILGDLFGSSGGKKPNKNKKKQAPLQPITTTRRPRPSRRPARRPATRTTTPRTIRTTTVRIRPVNRRPTRRPTRKPTTANANEISSSALTTILTTPSTPLVSAVTAKLQTEKENQITSVSDYTFEPIVAHRAPSTTPKSVTNFEDPGLEMSLAHITGQLSSMPVIPLNSKDEKGSSKVEKEMAYEKVETITRKPVASDENVSDDMVQIVQSLDSNEDIVTDKEALKAEETRGLNYYYGSIREGSYEGLSLPKKKHRDEFQLEDLDLLDLTSIGETIGDQLGIFGGKKRQNRHTEEKEPDYSDYHEVVDTMEDALLMARTDKGNKNKKNRRRQNKMMRGEWSQV